MVAERAQPALTSSTDMLKFMEDALRELEEAQGGQDPQARAQLDKLRQQTAALSRMEGQAQQLNPSAHAAVDEMAIAGQIDNLDGQLRSLEASIAKADPATQQLFSQSTALWLQQQQRQQQEHIS
ncbi:TPA: hypothetical protein ACH3X2_006951 [Trebouxia sp. C0005]|nr:MAG: hypothetical protein FRX49_08073 [Trebouxia sp. A1-2]